MIYLLLACGSEIVSADKNIATDEEVVTTSEETDETNSEVDGETSTDSEITTETGTDTSTATDTTTQTESETETETEEETLADLVDFSQLGNYAVVSSTESTNVTNCPGMSYHVYAPENLSNPPVMVLGHGFARGGSKVVEWAEHFASWGVEVLVPMDLCHYNFLGVDHEMNGQNMMELAAHHGAQDPIYGGHSAGGLAALIAASMDSNTLGLIGLDATDTEGVPTVPDFIGQSYAPQLTAPAFGLIAEPSSCNAENNGITLLGLVPDSYMLRIKSSDHCDFEYPTDGGCEFLCLNDNTTFDDSEIRPMIRSLSTAALMHLTGMHADGEAYWFSPVLDELVATGLVQEL